MRIDRHARITACSISMFNICLASVAKADSLPPAPADLIESINTARDLVETAKELENVSSYAKSRIAGTSTTSQAKEAARSVDSLLANSRGQITAATVDAAGGIRTLSGAAVAGESIATAAAGAHLAAIVTSEGIQVRKSNDLSGKCYAAADGYINSEVIAQCDVESDRLIAENAQYKPEGAGFEQVLASVGSAVGSTASNLANESGDKLARFLGSATQYAVRMYQSSFSFETTQSAIAERKREVVTPKESDPVPEAEQGNAESSPNDVGGDFWQMTGMYHQEDDRLVAGDIPSDSCTYMKLTPEVKAHEFVDLLNSDLVSGAGGSGAPQITSVDISETKATVITRGFGTAINNGITIHPPSDTLNEYVLEGPDKFVETIVHSFMGNTQIVARMIYSRCQPTQETIQQWKREAGCKLDQSWENCVSDNQ